ncbi:MAG: efflux RND transporter permease subunit [Bacteroidales bacterium]|nr:efflux RND transporter permease subunit [Candidatus Cryptobacteroides onthequi]MCQ2164339.1 efflux RND transporter permease subunit [Bacteroidales bacterium]
MLRRLLDRPVTVTMIMLVAIVLGIVGIRHIPVSLIPDVDVPYVTVKVSAPGVPARELEQSVVRPLRQRFMQINALDDITAVARDEDAVIRLTFDHGTRMNLVFIEVNEQIDRAMSSLPGIPRPKVFKAGAGDIPAFYVNLSSAVEGTHGELSDYACQIFAKRLEQLSTVAMVDVSGYTEDEILIIPDIDKLSQMNITPEQLGTYISSADVHLGSLSIRDGEYRFSVRFKSFVTDRRDVEDIWFRVGDRTLQVKDVAQVVQVPVERLGLVRSDGHDAVTLAVIKQSNARMSELRRDVTAVLDDVARENPEIVCTVTRDQTELLEYSIDNLVLNVFLAIFFACLVIFLFMKDVRSAALVAITIPLALVFSAFVFYVTGMSANIISLSGFVLGVGMMVDNTIILTDNITSRWNRGDSLRDAVVTGTREVLGPMLSSVLTTCAVFLPLVFVSGTAGAMFSDQAVSVTVVLLSSYLVTVTVIPVYYWWWYRGSDSFHPSPLLRRLSWDSGVKLYDRILAVFLEKKSLSWGILLFCAGAVAVSLLFMPKSRLPEMSFQDAVLKIDWNEHITLAQNSDRMRRLEESISGRVSQMTSMTGVQQFVLDHSGDQSVSEASLYVRCSDQRSLLAIQDELSEAVSATWPSAVSSWAPSGNIFDMVFSEDEPLLVARLRPSSAADMDVDATLTAVADLDRLTAMDHLDRVQLKTDVMYVADPQMLALYGVSLSSLTGVLQNAIGGDHLFDIARGERQIHVVIADMHRDLAGLLSGLFVKTADGDVEIPVSSLVRQTYTRDFKEIISGPEGVYYPYDIDCPDGSVPAAMDAVRENVLSGDSFDVSFSGSWFKTRHMVEEMALVFLIAFLLLFLILASQFESLIQPLIILSEILVDVAISLLVLWVTGIGLNLMSLIGLVVICGIIINDSILKIDTINRLRSDGIGLEEAIHTAGHRRLKAIMMTSLTTILAVCPFLGRGSMGDDLQFPMAVVIIVGMTVGTFVSLFMVPAIYSAIYSRRKK